PTAVRLVCVVPEGSDARVFTLVDGAVISRDLIQPSDSARRIAQDGCTGTERVTWAQDGARLFRAAELDCQGGLHQAVSQLLAISRTGEWLDVQGVTIDDRAGVRAQHFREAASLTGV